MDPEVVSVSDISQISENPSENVEEEEPLPAAPVSKRSKRRMQKEDRRSSGGGRPPGSGKSAASILPPRRNSAISEDEDADELRRGGHKPNKIQQVLKQLKEDVVPLNRNSREGKTKWKTMVQNMQQTSFGGVGDGGAASLSHLRIEDELHHERVDKSQVGADIYSNKWKKMTRYTNSFQKPETKSTIAAATVSERSMEVNNNNDQLKHQYEDESPQQAINSLYSVTKYFSGILAGLLLWSTLFAVSNVNGDSVLVKGHVFMTISSLVTTFVLLIVVVGFINSAFTLEGSVADLEKLIYHLIPVLLILITHYLSKAFELKKMECTTYLQLRAEHREKIHQSYSCSKYNQTSLSGGVAVNSSDNDIGFMFLHLLPWIGAMGIYTYLYIVPKQPNNRN